jgi:hypothetical protein
MFTFIKNIFNNKINKKIVKETPFTKEYRQGYNKLWINDIRKCNFLV